MQDKDEDQIVYGITKENLWAHVQVEKIIKNMKYGSLTITFRVHEEEVTDLMTQEYKRFRKPKES